MYIIITGTIELEGQEASSGYVDKLLFTFLKIGKKGKFTCLICSIRREDETIKHWYISVKTRSHVVLLIGGFCDDFFFLINC